mmetsp:Transcript_5168/g.15274  ORF Transcript_5168/g.15274 Transcript_5168/m.15274 type:complete len:267 (-) Transcript_5168:189-989(-)
MGAGYAAPVDAGGPGEAWRVGEGRAVPARHCGREGEELAETIHGQISMQSVLGPLCRRPRRRHILLVVALPAGRTIHSASRALELGASSGQPHLERKQLDLNDLDQQLDNHHDNELEHNDDDDHYHDIRRELLPRLGLGDARLRQLDLGASAARAGRLLPDHGRLGTASRGAASATTGMSLRRLRNSRLVCLDCRAGGADGTHMVRPRRLGCSDRRLLSLCFPHLRLYLGLPHGVRSVREGQEHCPQSQVGETSEDCEENWLFLRG